MHVHRIEVFFKPKAFDAFGELIRHNIAELGISTTVRTVKVYTIVGDLSREELHLLAEELFRDKITQDYSIDEPLGWEWLIEISFKPGVTDTEGQTAKSAIKDLLHKDVEVYTSRKYLFNRLTHSQAEQIARELANDLIQNVLILRGDEIKRFKVTAPLVNLKHIPTVSTIDLCVSDEELLEISRQRLLALNLEEMKVIRDYFSKKNKNKERELLGLPKAPTDVELEALAQSWSEHCRHKIFRGLIEYHDERGKKIIDSVFHTYIKGATEAINPNWLVSVFEDNAGVIKLDEEYNLTFKVETHNSPSALDPYGGAITGIVGVNRDPLGTGIGSRLIFNTDVFCFAPPNYDKKLPKGVLHPKRIFEGVRRGVEHGGNKSGIPTVNGTIRFDDRYLGQPLVYCGTGGIMPSFVSERPSHKKHIDPGDLIVMVGGRIGKDGIHGATFSSGGLHEESPTSAVQIGDPFTQKVMADMLLEARDLGLYKAIHDNGAGGLSASVAELAQISGGCEIWLEKAPLKYEGLDPWEILLSESQERMTLAVSPDKIKDLLTLSQRRDVEATVIGRFTNTGKFHVLYEGKTVAYLGLKFLLEGHPKKRMTAYWRQLEYKEPKFEQPQDLGKILHQMLSRLNICSKEYVIRQYDHEVQGGVVVKPLVGKHNDGPADAAVIWPLEMMRKGSKRGIVVSNGINHNYGDIDTYWMAACAVDEAIRNAVAVGADPDRIALLDNFSWSSSDDPFRLAQLVRACEALYDCAVAFKTPFISGKDSMYNDFEGELEGVPIKLSVPPTLLISALGVIEDIEKATAMDLKSPGNLIYLVGPTKPELGGSEYYALMALMRESCGKRYNGKSVPKVKPKEAKRTYNALHRAIMDGAVESCHDLSEGGLGVAAAEMAFAGGVGMKLSLSKVSGAEKIKRDDLVLFSESPSRLLVEVRPGNREKFEEIMSDCIYSLVGETIEEGRLIITGLSGEEIISEGIDLLKESWQKPLDW
jgi:phosphoribosylformylglycinamidine synthase